MVAESISPTHVQGTFQERKAEGDRGPSQAKQSHQSCRSGPRYITGSEADWTQEWICLEQHWSPCSVRNMADKRTLNPPGS